jgi:NIMA (never in mitosis gene a)-related kinase
LQYDSKCDIWSIGCVIYELCCLSQPFKATDFPSLFRKVLKGEFAPIPSKYSENMKELVRMCLTS